MIHRKIIHEEITKICRNFQKEHCRFDESECWYKHEKQNDEQIIYTFFYKKPTLEAEAQVS